MSSIIIDTSVIIAYLNRNEKYHKWAVENFKQFLPLLIICESVLQEEFESINFLLQQYSDIPISLADAFLIRMTEIFPDSKIITLDSDFRIYRKNKNQKIELIIP